MKPHSQATIYLITVSMKGQIHQMGLNEGREQRSSSLAAQGLRAEFFSFRF
jgi:hypothetical protein